MVTTTANPLIRLIQELAMEIKPFEGKTIEHPVGYECNIGVGHSCSALSVISRISRELNMNIQARHYFDRRYIVIMRGPEE